MNQAKIEQVASPADIFHNPASEFVMDFLGNVNVFRGRIEGVDERPLDREIVALHWLSRDELLERRAQHRSPLVQRCVDDYLAGRSFPLEIFSSEYA